MTQRSAPWRTARRYRPSPVVASVLRSGGARMIVLPMSAILGIVNTRLIIEHFGQAAYAQYGLLVGIGSLIPFADLGVSAAVMNVVGGSSDPRTDPRVRAVLVTAVRMLLASMIILLCLTALVGRLGWWRSLLGDGLVVGSGPVAATACCVLIAVSLPAAFGQRILAATGANHWTVIVLGLQTPIVLLVVVGLVTSGGSGAYLPALPYLVAFALTIALAIVAARRISPMVGDFLRDVPRVATVRGEAVFDVAWPTVVQMIALPIAMQTDRLILSHVGSLSDLSRYNLAAQMFTPIWGVVNAAGVALWPVFARARAQDGPVAVSPTRMAVGFAAVAAAASITVAVLSAWLASVASNGTVQLGLPLTISFAVFMVLQAAKYPLGMYMTDARGMRYQAAMIVLLLPVNLGLSWYLAQSIGAAGPVIGSALSVAVCQVAANWIYVRRDLARRTGRPVNAAPVDQSE